MRILSRPERCLACGACELACVLAHSDASDAVSAARQGARPSGVVVRAGLPRATGGPRGSTGPEKAGRAYPVRCHQCDDPGCVLACAAGALEKGEDGIVRVLEGQCVGCGMCVMACHYGAIIVDRRRRLAVKCDLCGGERVPACVLACKTEALVLVQDEGLR